MCSAPSSPGPAPGHCPVIRTEHFCLTERHRGRIEVCHWLRPDQLDNDVTGLLADELFAPGWLSGAEVFERVFTGVVRSCIDDPLLAWSTFYGNTLARIRQCWRAPDTVNGPGQTTISGFAPVYAHALQLIPAGQVLDVGSCYGSSRCCWPSAGQHGNRVRPVRWQHVPAEGRGRRARAAGEHPGM